MMRNLDSSIILATKVHPELVALLTTQHMIDMFVVLVTVYGAFASARAQCQQTCCGSSGLTIRRGLPYWGDPSEELCSLH